MQNLEDLLKQIEGCEIEYKLSKTKLSKDLWETYSAFANTNGGYIILGMRQLGQKFEIEGVDNVEKQIDDLYNTAANQQKVSINLLDNNSVKTCTHDFRLPEINTSSKDTFLKIWMAYPKDSYPEYDELTRDVLLYIQGHNAVSVSKIRTELNAKDYQVRKSIEVLVKDKHISRIGNGKATKCIKSITALETIAVVDNIKALLLQ